MTLLYFEHQNVYPQQKDWLMPTEDPKATLLAQDPSLEMIDLVADKHQIRVDTICAVHAQIDELKACGFNIE